MGGVDHRTEEMWRHLLPAATILSGWPACNKMPVPSDVSDHAIIHLETAEDDIQALELQLCTAGHLHSNVLGVCPRLPRLSHRNTGFVRMQSPPWPSLWDAKTVAYAQELYNADFDAFSYSRDRLRVKPLMVSSSNQQRRQR